MVQEKINPKAYFAREGSRFSEKDAGIIGPALDPLRGLTPREIVESASDKNSPLHPYFEWDDRKCGVNYRRLQATDMVRSIEVVWLRGDEEVQAGPTHRWVKVTTLDENDKRVDERGHPARVLVPVEEAASTCAIAEEMLERAYSELVSFKSKYKRELSLFSSKKWSSLFVTDLFPAIDRIERARRGADADLVTAD